MPSVKNARLRHRIIEECLRNSFRPFPSIDDLREVCEERLFGTIGGGNISKSTIEKDLREMKEEYDAPIAFNRAEKGYYYSDPDFTMDSIPFTSDDAEALRFAAMTLNQYRHVSIFDQFQSAIGKIIDRVNISDKMDDDAITQFVQFETIPEVPGSQWLNTFFSAIKNRTALEIRYHSYSSKQEKDYLIHPYLLKEYRNRWYVIAWRIDLKRVATFELGRVKDLKVLRETFERSADFDPEAFFKYAFGVTVLNGKPEKVVLEFENNELRYIIDAPLHPSQKLIKEGKEWSQVELEVFVTHELVMNILSFGNKVKVIKPASLVTQIKESV